MPGLPRTAGRSLAASLVAGLLALLPGAPALAAGRGPPPPLVGHVEPDRGPAAGGTPVTIVGSDFRPGARVTVDGVAAAEVVVESASRISAVLPPHRPGAVHVAVRNVDWQQGGRARAFTYLDGGGATAPSAPRCSRPVAARPGSPRRGRGRGSPA